MASGVGGPEMGEAAKMMKVALNLNGSDDESIISSKGGSDSGDEEKDLLKALAQRATDPYIKARKAKGPFVYVKPRLRPGRHIYIDEEIQKTQDYFIEEQLRQKLKGAQYRITGLVKFDKHGLAKGFEVQEVAAAISSAVKAVLHEERAAMGGSSEQHPGLQEQLGADFASKVAERAAWSDPVFEEAVRAARSQALTTSHAIPQSPTSPSAQASLGPSTAQTWPPTSGTPNQPTSVCPLQSSPPTNQLSSPHPLHFQQSPPPSAPSWGGPLQGAQILNLEQTRPPTSIPAASLFTSPSFAPLPSTPAQQQQQQQQQQQLPEGWEGHGQLGGQSSHPASPFLQEEGEVEQHTHVPLDFAQHQDSSSPFLHQQGWTQGEGYGTRSIEKDSKGRTEDGRYPRPDTRGVPEERGFDPNRGHSGHDRGEKGAYHDDGRTHLHDRHARHQHSRGGLVRRSSSSSRDRHHHHRRHRHHNDSRDKHQVDGMRRGSLEGERRRVRAEDKGRFGHGGEPRGHWHSSRREGKRYKEERYRQEGGSRREERRLREDDHRSGGKEGHRRHWSRPDKEDPYREHRHSSRPKGAGKDGGSRQRRPESRRHVDDIRARSRDMHYSSSKDAYRRPDTGTQPPRTAATSTSKPRAKKQPESERDSLTSEDSRFPGMEVVLQSEEAAAFLRPAVSSGSEAEPDLHAQPRNPAEVKARLHGNPRARLMHEARKERWTSSDDDGGFSEYVRQSKATG